MNREDLPLIAFTLLVQMALGAVALAAMLPLRLAGVADPSRLVEILLLFAWSLLMLAFATSLLHLGVPGGALRALRNVRTSWLSREVLFTGLFTGLTMAAALAQLFGLPSADLTWMAALTGLATIFTMSRLYQSSIRPAWMTPYTPLSFFAAAVTLGAALGAPIIAALPLPTVAIDLLLHDIVISGAVAATVTLISSAIFADVLRERRLLLAVRLLLAAGGMGLLAYGWQVASLGLVALGAGALLAGEVLGRIRFFALGSAQM